MNQRFPTLCVAVLALALMGGGTALAQTGPDQLYGDAEEKAALQSAETGKWIRAREQAEAVRARDPNSIIANYVLAEVFHEWESNHARALFLSRHAKRLLLDAFGQAPTESIAQIWHKRLLRQESFIVGEMDDKATQLKILDEYDALYSPKLTRMRIWPLMKLGRYDEAREIGEKLTLSDDENETVSAYNGLMALEDELLDRRASYRWGKKGIERTQGRSCILLHNTSQSALTLFEFQEAEALARKALRADRQDCPNPSYEHLANLYLLQGQFNKTVSAFKKLVRYPVERRYRPQFFMGNRSILVELLYALGKVEDGLKLAKQVFDAPDRAGMTSVSTDDIAFAHGFAYWLALDQRIQQLADQTATRTMFSRVGSTLDRRGLQVDQFEVGRRLQRLAIVDDILVTNLRPYLRGVKPWYAGHLIDAMGSGLFSAALDRAEALDEAVVDKVGGYYASLRGEVAYKGGDYATAIRRGRDALTVLPKEMALLRWRTMTYVAAARLATGDAGGDTLAMLREVLHKYPTAFRHLNVAVPVRVQSSTGESDFVDDVIDAIDDSPRFDVGGRGFVIDVSFRDADLEMCLRTEDGFRFACASHEVDTMSGDDAAAAVDTLVETALAPKVEMTAADINSLDGSTVRVNADQILDGLLDGPKKPGEEDEE